MVGMIVFYACAIMYLRYRGVLASGASPKSSPSRQSYDALRASLIEEGGFPARIYASWLRSFLDARRIRHLTRVAHDRQSALTHERKMRRRG